MKHRPAPSRAASPRTALRAPVAAALALCACAGEASTRSPADAALDAALSDDASIADAPAPQDVSDVPAAPFPAFHPELPTIANGGGPVLRAPRIVPVFVSGDGADAGLDDTGTTVMDFLRRYAASATWSAQVAEYGVGPATVAPPRRADPQGLPLGTVSAGRLHAWAASQINAGAWGDDSGDAFFVVILDASRQVQLTSASVTCRGVGGYHTEVSVNGRGPRAIAVIPECGGGIAGLTRVLSHELVEGVTDPFPSRAPAYGQPSTGDPPTGQWAVAFNGGEVGDMCETRQDALYFAPDVGYSVSRSWSNAAARAGVDPCVPVPQGAVYFNAVIDAPETVAIRAYGGLSSAQAQGVTIPMGESRTLDVRLFSTAPMRRAWSVYAREVLGNARPALRFTWDRATGRNGDVLHLTITAVGDASDGRVFEVVSTLDRASTSWVGAVVTQ